MEVAFWPFQVRQELYFSAKWQKHNRCTVRSMGPVFKLRDSNLFGAPPWTNFDATGLRNNVSATQMCRFVGVHACCRKKNSKVLGSTPISSVFVSVKREPYSSSKFFQMWAWSLEYLNIWSLIALYRLQYRRNVHRKRSSEWSLVVGISEWLSTYTNLPFSIHMLPRDTAVRTTLQIWAAHPQASLGLTLSSHCGR